MAHCHRRGIHTSAISSRNNPRIPWRATQRTPLYRLCAALYDPTSNELILWTTYRLPYARDIRAQFQVQREYLGHLLAIILLTRHGHREVTTPLSYEWINDNTGALKWAQNHKCASEVSQYACLAVSQLHQRAKISIRATTHRAGIHMGEIDTMSRMHDNEHPHDEAVQRTAMSLQTAPSQVLALPTHYRTTNIVSTCRPLNPTQTQLRSSRSLHNCI